MGMANPELIQTPKPRYSNTIVCQHCFAEYDPTLKWIRGYYPAGSTANDFIKTTNIPEGKCPICRK